MLAMHTLANGLHVLIEPVHGVKSVAMDLRLPAGSMHEEDITDGCSTMLYEMLLRGTKYLDSKELTASLDRAGLQRSGGVGRRSIRLSGITTPDNLVTALQLMFDIAQHPLMDQEHIDPVRQLCLQSLEHLQDDPEEELGLALLARHLPPPFHRTGLGTKSGLFHVTTTCLEKMHAETCVPDGAVIALSGAVQDLEILELLTTISADWNGTAPTPCAAGGAPRGRVLIPRNTAQVHLAITWDAPSLSAPRSAAERLACATLGGHTSSRLFQEVRQRRSLCYSIGARYASIREQGRCTIRAGTMPDHAVELLDTCLSEKGHLHETLQKQDIDRARRSIVSALAMQGESTRARSTQLASEMIEFGSYTTLDARIKEFEGVSDAEVREQASAWAAQEPTVVAIGPAGCLPFEEWSPDWT